MKSGKKDRKATKATFGTTTMAQARKVLRKLFEYHTEENLLQGILLWLGHREDPTAFNLYLSIPKILEQHECSLMDFLEAKIDLPGIPDKQVLRTTGLAMLLLLFISECWHLFGKQLHANPDGPWPKCKVPEMLKAAIELVPLEEFQQELAGSMLAIVGKPYYDMFLEKVTIFDKPQTPERITKFENDPTLKPYLSFVIWFGLMRFFLDALYFYVGNDKN